MPRFRVTEDERLYLALRTEMYLRIVQHVPAQAVTEILRNFGKLEALVHFEGVKQGLAVATLAEAGDFAGIEALKGVNGLLPAEALAKIYGESDTPLAAAEKKWIDALVERDTPFSDSLQVSSWMSTKPVELPPMTIKEAIAKYGPDLGVEPAQPSSASAALVAAFAGAPNAPVAPIDISDPLAAMKQLEQSDDPLAAIRDTQVADQDLPVESPADIERVRERLTKLLSDEGGWRPIDWSDLILKLHVEMQIDAFWLDIQLSTDVGRAMLAQVGLPNVHPGAAVMFDQLVAPGST